MGYWVDPLKRPYDVHVLIEAYVYTRRTDFVHQDFTDYYAALFEALQPLLGIRLSSEGLSFEQGVLWNHFESTVGSLLRITSPWDGYLEAGLVHKMLKQSGEPGKVVDRASRAIVEANRASKAAHREMLAALVRAICGECRRVVTSDELLRAGFDDSREPDNRNYYDYL